MSEYNSFVKIIDKPYQFIKNSVSSFKNTFSEEDRDKLVMYTKKNTSNLFNGTVVRLDKFDYNKGYQFHISPLTYFDSLTTNMIFNKYSEKISQLENSVEEKNIKEIIKKIYDNGISSFEEVIDNKYLANTIAVSCLIKDLKENYALVTRNQNVAIGKGLLSVSVTGAVDLNDYDEEDPVLACAKREAREELGITIDVLPAKAIIISKKKLQPIFIVDAYINETWDNVVKRVYEANDFTQENTGIHIIPKSNLLSFSKGHSMTDAAKYHISSV